MSIMVLFCIIEVVIGGWFANIYILLSVPRFLLINCLIKNGAIILNCSKVVRHNTESELNTLPTCLNRSARINSRRNYSTHSLWRLQCNWRARQHHSQAQPLEGRAESIEDIRSETITRLSQKWTFDDSSIYNIFIYCKFSMNNLKEK